MTDTEKPKQRTVAITGAGAGLGRELRQTADSMTAGERELYGEAFGKFANALNSAQSSGLDVGASAERVIELIEQVPAPIRAAVGEDAEYILRLVRDSTDAELDLLRLKLAGLSDE